MIIPTLASLSQEEELALFWFRRDLRLADNCALYHALCSGLPVLPFFIFDTTILDKLEKPNDQRVQFIYEQIVTLKAALEKAGSTLLICYGKPEIVYQRLVEELPLRAVYTNRDYEPYARERDHAVGALLSSKQIAFHTFKDQVIFEKNELLKEDGAPYTVFTPYMTQWKKKLNSVGQGEFESHLLLHACVRTKPLPLMPLRALDFDERPCQFPSQEINLTQLQKYGAERDVPASRGTSQLSIHFRFGTISIRNAVRLARLHSEPWLNELIWREFYMMILWHFPHVVERSFKPAYDRIVWENDPAKFQAWCAGATGVPLVDAGMRELNATGHMHNRLRMVTASFLIKDLLIDWRWGEAYFAKRLLDFELASNNGGWQWVAGSGCDAAPYFRVFNPYLQAKKFDPEQHYITKWVPEWQQPSYPIPLVAHDKARRRAVAAYQQALGRNISAS